MNLLNLVPLCALSALGFALYLAVNIMKKDEGTDKMKEIANAVKEGAQAYLSRQYKIVALVFGGVFTILFVLALQGYLTLFVPFAFLSGGFFSGLCGYCGMNVATSASSRTASACRTSLSDGLRIAFSSGSIMGLIVVGFGLLDLSVWYFSLNWYYHVNPQAIGIDKISTIATTMLTFGMGASFQALFARVGGGIFTKGADVGADLVGKVEAGIPEDDPRNPATIADNVGDNVGDVAGMGADLYESYVGSIVAAATLGVTANLGFAGFSLPFVLAGVGILASIIGTFFVKSGEEATQGALLLALRKGVFSASAITAVMTFVIVWLVLGKENMGLAWSVIIGLGAGIIIGLATEYFTSSSYRPVKELSQTSLTGPATIIIGGLSTGMMSTVVPVVVVSVAIGLSYVIAGGLVSADRGIYGIGIAAVGMLSTLGITLATDAYGPVADNAGGNAEMAHLGPEVRKRTDALDSLGNTTAATGKGFAIGSAALTALALISAYKASVIANGGNMVLDLLSPLVLIGLFLGTMMPFIFAALTMSAVGRAGSKIVVEVRRQFKEIKGLMEGTAKPDYASCVKIVTAAAQKEMIEIGRAHV